MNIIYSKGNCIYVINTSELPILNNREKNSEALNYLLNREKEQLKFVQKRQFIKNDFKSLMNNLAFLNDNIGKYVNLSQKVAKSEKVLKKKFI